MAVSSRVGLRIAVIGSGISGLAAAWLLSGRHDVTLFEKDGRTGGHANTVSVRGPDGEVPVDMGFIVFNPETYPNLTSLFAHLGVATVQSNMSFAFSRGGGDLEYAGSDAATLFAQPRNALSPSFWSMLCDIRRFYARAPVDLPRLAQIPETLGRYLEHNGYGKRFRDDHLLPMAAAIWSAAPGTMLDYPAESFIRFFMNHGLLKLRDRPAWHTVRGGSKEYVSALLKTLSGRIRKESRVTRLRRGCGGVTLYSDVAGAERFDHAIIATHADEALAILDDASEDERSLLGAFSYVRNRAVLHTDASLMPKRKRVWSSWNYLDAGKGPQMRPQVTYWMNRLQALPCATDYFVTLNPATEPRGIVREEAYAHPLFDARAVKAQERLWALQGVRNTWFCGAYFGAGFHEDGLQAGLAVAEDLGGARRPWRVGGESSRIHRGPCLPLKLRDAV